MKNVCYNKGTKRKNKTKNVSIFQKKKKEKNRCTSEIMPIGVGKGP
jgi:hypothetical protein